MSAAVAVASAGKDTMDKTTAAEGGSTEKKVSTHTTNTSFLCVYVINGCRVSLWWRNDDN